MNQSERIEQLMVRPRKAAAMLDLNRTQIYRLMGSTLPVCKVGNSLRIPLKAIQELIDKATISTATKTETEE